MTIYLSPGRRNTKYSESFAQDLQSCSRASAGTVLSLMQLGHIVFLVNQNINGANGRCCPDFRRFTKAVALLKAKALNYPAVLDSLNPKIQFKPAIFANVELLTVFSLWWTENQRAGVLNGFFTSVAFKLHKCPRFEQSSRSRRD